MNAVAWAAPDLLVCAVDDTGALYLGEVTADGSYTSTQRIEIATPSPLWLARGGGDAMVALCGASLPVLLRLNVDLQRRCVGSTTAYSLDAPAACIATAVASPASTNVFVVDALGISRYSMDHDGASYTAESARVRVFGTCSAPDVSNARPQVADVPAQAASDERTLALFSSKFDEIKRLLLQSRQEVRSDWGPAVV